MMEKKPDINLDLELAAFFDAAKAAETPPNAALLEAVAADALKISNERVKNNKRPVSPTPWWRVVLHNIGGWQPVTALTASVFLGIIAGYIAPDSLDYLDNTQTATEDFSIDSFSVASDIETLFQEG